MIFFSLWKQWSFVCALVHVCKQSHDTDGQILKDLKAAIPNIAYLWEGHLQ